MDTIVKEIHKEFREAIANSEIMGQINDDKSDVTKIAVEYNELLREAGLTTSSAYKETKKIVEKQSAVDYDNKAFQEILENQAIFPANRLIGLKQLFNICRKYDLYIATIDQYTGDIPEKNLMEILKFKKIIPSDMKSFKFRFDRYSNTLSVDRIDYRTNHNPMLIVAPLNMIQLHESTRVFDRLAINNDVDADKPGKFMFKPGVPNMNVGQLIANFLDPIVLMPSVYNKLGYFFNIVSAWGDEAEDEYVTNKIKIEKSEN